MRGKGLRFTAWIALALAATTALSPSGWAVTEDSVRDGQERTCMLILQRIGFEAFQAVIEIKGVSGDHDGLVHRLDTFELAYYDYEGTWDGLYWYRITGMSPRFCTSDA